MAKSNFNVEEVYDSVVVEDFAEEDMNISVRKIKNGYIISRSWRERKPDGESEYMHEEEFTPENPTLQVSSPVNPQQ